MKTTHSKKRAFTIVELIIVIAVIGVLAAILIPSFANMIARANAKSALADARNTLTSYLAENLEIIDGDIAASIVIFINKANMYYVFGYSNSGPDMGKLMQSGGNPYKTNDLAELIDLYNCPEQTILGTDEESNYAFFLYPHDQPSGTGSGIKGRSMEDINNSFINLTDRMGGDLPSSSQVFDGFLIGMIVDANVIIPGDGTRPGEKPGGGGSAPGGEPSDDPGGDPSPDQKYALAVNVVPSNAATAVIEPNASGNMYDKGSTVNISFTQTSAQKEMYSFVRYSVAGSEVSTSETYTITMDSSKAVVINFSAGAWDGSEDPNDDFGGGSGTNSNPYIITTPQQLYHLSKKVQSGTTYSGKYFIVANDINLNDGTINAQSSGANVWLPIGKDTAFKGSFDGQGHTISGIYIVNTASTGTYLALFGYIDAATIKRVNVANSYIKGYERIAGIVATSSASSITDCSADITLESARTTNTMIGGIVGRSLASTITHCASFGSITSSGHANGGIVGMCAGSPNTITKCINECDVVGRNMIAGILGSDSNESLSSTISECVNNGSISGAANVGGIVGDINTPSGYPKITDCYNMGAVNSTGQYAGGIAGVIRYTTLTNSYNCGKVTSSTTNYSAVTGGKDGNSPTTNNYYLNTSCGATTTSGSSKTEAEMKALAPTLGNKFRNDTTPNINSGYPILNWQSDSPIEKPTPGSGGGSEAPPTYTLMYLDGDKYIASLVLREGEKTVVRPAIEKEGSKFISWKYNGSPYLPGSAFTMPANDVTMSADWLSLPAGEYFYEAKYAVGVANDYEVFLTFSGTAPAGTQYTPSQEVVSAYNPAYSIIDTSPFTVEAHNDNLFVIFCAEGISSAEQFDDIRNALGGTYFLLNDIDLSGYPAWNPIGTHTAEFTGSLNGNGHSISGMQISNQFVYQGLFGTNSGTIENLHIVGANIAVGSNSGILAGWNGGSIVCCSTLGTIKAGSTANLWALGGIAGLNEGIIDQCWSDANVTAIVTSQQYYGGFAGQNLSGGVISNSYFCGSVTGARSSSFAGLFEGTITNCYTVGRVYTMGDTWARPTVGQLGNSYTFNNCVAQQMLMSRNGSKAYNWDACSWTLNCSTATEMLESSTYTSKGWDTGIWNIVNGQLPTLKNNPKPTPPVANPWPGYQ